MKYYTGLPNYKTLMAVFNYVTRTLYKDVGYNSLSLFQQFIITLIKLRLNLGDQDIAYWFKVNQSTVARYIQKWIDILYIRLNPLIQWPDIVCQWNLL